MNELEQAAANVKELAEKIVRCAERVESYAGVLATEEAELKRLKSGHKKAQEALIHAAQGNTLKCVESYME